jgi:hypothetical protein
MPLFGLIRLKAASFELSGGFGQLARALAKSAKKKHMRQRARALEGANVAPFAAPQKMKEEKIV